MTNYSLTRRYWMSLISLTSSVVLDGYSLWSRYWATLFGSPPRPGAADSTQTNGATASLVIPDVPRKRMRVRKSLVAVAAVATAIAAAFTGPLISITRIMLQSLWHQHLNRSRRCVSMTAPPC